MVFKSNYPDVDVPTNTSLTQHVFKNVKKYYGRVAYVDAVSNNTIKYDDIVGLINRVAKGLISAGLKKGDVVTTVCTNVLEYPLIFHGVLSAGGIISPTNPVNTVDDFAYQFSHTKTKFVFAVKALVEKVQQALKLTGLTGVKIFVISEQQIGGTLLFSSLLENDGQFAEVKINSSDIAAIPYSSGTTGRPKGVLLSHYALKCNMCQFDKIHEVLGETMENRVNIAPLPVFHIMGLGNFLLLYPHFGGKVVMMPFFDFELFLKLIQTHKATHLNLVPQLLLAFVKNPIVDKYDLSSLQLVNVAAAPLGVDLQQTAVTKLKIKIGQGYGMTEIPTAVSISPKSRIKVGAAGMLIPNALCKVVSVTDGKTELGPDQDGELWFKCPNMMSGYLDNKEATDNTIDKDGYLHTGDVGHFDCDGFLFIVDRVKELIKYKGYQVAPAELEAHLFNHPSVFDAAVVGKLEEAGSELPTAFVVLKPDQKHTLPHEIVTYVDAKVAPYKKLRGGVILTDVIPRTSTGKIQRQHLRAKLNAIAKL